jgi:hypothetical protein
VRGKHRVTVTSTTADELPASESCDVADTATYIASLCAFEPNKAGTATDEPTVSGREDVPNESADGDWQRLSSKMNTAPLRTSIDGENE